jgi:hypothetical protein
MICKQYGFDPFAFLWLGGFDSPGKEQNSARCELVRWISDSNTPGGLFVRQNKSRRSRTLGCARACLSQAEPP